MWYIIDEQSFHVYFHQSLNGRRVCYLIFSAGYMHMCKCNDFAAYSHHFQSMCTRFLYTSVESACGTLQTNRQIKSNCLTKRITPVQVIHISVLCCDILNCNNCAAVLDHFRSTLKSQLYTVKDRMCGTL